MVAKCNECKLEVASKAALVAHWEEQRAENKKHYHCSKCVVLFHTPEGEDRHHKEFHAAKQDLACPGCDQRFVAAAGLIEHIERNRCKRIKNDDYAAQREDKLAFARELQRRHYGEAPDPADELSVANLSVAETTAGGKAPYNFTQFLSRAKDGTVGTPSLSSLRPKAEGTVRPNPVTFAVKEVESPQLSAKQPEIHTGNTSGGTQKPTGNPWAQKKNLFPDAPAAVRPPPELQQALWQPAQAAGPAWAPHDPRDPKWDPAAYFVTYLGKYKCPHDRCPKSFPAVAGLRAHLLSAKHAGLIKVQCPRCCNWFDSMSALMAHAESQSVRCRIRETDGYRQFMDQATAGILDTTEKHADGTEKYAVPDEARERFETSQGRWVKEQQFKD